MERQQLDEGIVSAYLASRKGWSSDVVLADPELNYYFIEKCKRKGLPGTPRDWNRHLLRLRKAQRLPKIECRRRILTLRDMDDYTYASEIAAQQLRVDLDLTLDAILCDPDLAKRFDELAAKYSPGFSPFEYRWAALTIRKRVKRCRVLAAKYFGPHDEKPKRIDFDAPSNCASYPVTGVYMLVMASDMDSVQPAYVGETFNIARRLERTQTYTAPLFLLTPKAIWEVLEKHLGAYKSLLVDEYTPTLNYRETRRGC